MCGFCFSVETCCTSVEGCENLSLRDSKMITFKF